MNGIWVWRWPVWHTIPPCIPARVRPLTLPCSDRKLHYLLIGYILYLKLTGHLSDWTEVMQERFQRAYAGIREKQATVYQDDQYYKPMMSRFEVEEWVWVLYPKIKPGSCDKLRSFWTGSYQIIRKISPALAEVMEVYESGNLRCIKRSNEAVKPVPENQAESGSGILGTIHL